MFSGLITSKTRVNILMRLFLNPDQHSYLRELSSEFGVSPSLVRDELRQLSKAGFLTSKKKGRQIHYRANNRHPLFNELHSMVRKALGMDKILDSIVSRLGNLEAAYLLDDYAVGKDTGIIDLLLVGDIDPANLADLVAKTERYIGRKIRTLVVDKTESVFFKTKIAMRPIFPLWQALNNVE